MPAESKAPKIVPGMLIAERYRVTRPIGRGGMAQVFEGVHADIGKRVAIKVLSAEFTHSAVVVERFLREARAAASVRSPYICDVYDSGKLEDGRPFLVMELLEGESLYERMVRVRLFDPKSTIRIVTHTARGLTKAHAANIVHRDLKPENIFLTTNEEGELHAKLLDFGLAKFYAPVEGGAGEARLTREGAIFGTPAYMSPEQVKGQGNVDHRADVWALGCIVYECFTGRTVWSTDQGIAMTFAQIASAALPKISKYRPDLPPALDAWFSKALNRDIDARFQTAKDLAEGLIEALEPPTRLPLESVSRLYRARLDESGPIDAVLGEHAFDSGKQTNPNGEPLGDAVATLGTPTPFPSPVIAHPPSPSIGNAVTERPPPVDGPPSSGIKGGVLPPPSPSTPAIAAQPAQPSLVEVATTNTVKGSTAPPQPPNRVLRAVGIVSVIGVLGVAGWFAFDMFLGNPVRTGIQEKSASPGLGSALASASASATTNSSSVSSGPDSASNAPKWMAAVLSGQQALNERKLDQAQKAFREAFEAGGTATARGYRDHADSAATNKGPCQLSGLGRLRSHSLVGGMVSRPVVVKSSTSLVALWADDHESPGHQHVYAQRLDDQLRANGGPIDVTPEAKDVTRFSAEVVGGNVVVFYGQSAAPLAGLYIRQLDSEGRIVAPEARVGSPKAASAWLSIVASPKADSGTAWMIWTEEKDTDGEDLMLRQIDARGALGNEIRVTDLAKGRLKTKISWPQISATPTTLELVFKVERDPNPTVDLIHLQQNDPDLASNNMPAIRGPRVDRFLGSFVKLTDKDRADQTSAACTADMCYAAWHSSAGAVVAQIDPASGRRLWEKKFAPQGAHPVVGANQKSAYVAWFEAGKVKLAPLAREGVGPSSIVARVLGDQPRGNLLVSEASGEVVFGWTDFEGNRLEPWLLRAACQ